MPGCDCQIEAKNAAERRTLLKLLLINGVMFVVGVAGGIVADSTALVADSLDMLADASVYALSLFAVGKAAQHKHRAAMLSGLFQIALAGMVIVDVIRRFVGGSVPESGWMMAIALLALLANSYGLHLLSKHRKDGVHMRASWIFTQNDVIANLSVIVAGGLVVLLNSRLPDLIAGFAIASLVIWGGVSILQEARREKAARGHGSA